MSTEIEKAISRSLLKLVGSILLYVIVMALTNYIASLLHTLEIKVPQDYILYANILISLGFGYLILINFSNVVYWSLHPKYGRSTSQAVRNVIKIIGIGALVSSIAGAVAGGAAGVALGGFLGIVIGMASQQTIGQAVAGLLLLLSRPIKIGDKVVVAGEEGTVDDISVMFTKVIKTDNTVVYIPNNTILTGKIVVKS